MDKQTEQEIPQQSIEIDYTPLPDCPACQGKGFVGKMPSLEEGEKK